MKKLFLSLIVMMAAATASAQWAVTDAGNLSQNLKNFKELQKQVGYLQQQKKLLDESLDMLKAICQTGKVVAMDLVEVAPTYDPTGCTERLAALTMLQVIAHTGKKLHENDNK